MGGFRVGPIAPSDRHERDVLRVRKGRPSGRLVPVCEGTEAMTYTVSGDSHHTYVSDESGRIVATCEQLADADAIAAALNGWDRAVRWLIEHQECPRFAEDWAEEKRRAERDEVSAAPFIIATWGSDPWLT